MGTIQQLSRHIGGAVAAACITVGCMAAPSMAAANEGAWQALSPAEKQSSYGWFVWQSERAETSTERADAANAADVLEHARYAAYTHFGEDGDATSLPNTYAAIQHAAAINEYRAGLPNEPCRTDLPEGQGRKCDDVNRRLEPLLLTSTLLAQAQSDVNYSADAMNHAMQFNISENLAWGPVFTQSGTAPWDAAPRWYSEKAAYDASGGQFNSGTGHYINLTNPDYGSGAVAVSNDGTTYPYIVGQVYSRSSQGVLPEDYLSEFESYAELVQAGYSPDQSPDTIIVYRLRNASNGLHLYTSDAREMFVLLTGGWQSEGIAFLAIRSDANQGIEVHRLRSPNGQHLLSTDPHEAEVLSESGWVDEGVAFKASNDGTPVYRFHGGNSGEHLYTIDENEVNVNVTRYGYSSDGVVFRIDAQRIE